MVDDFWGDAELDNFLEQMKQHVFPEDQYDPQELPLDHEIFRCVYRLKRSRRSPASTPGAGPGADMGMDRRRQQHADSPLPGH